MANRLYQEINSITEELTGVLWAFLARCQKYVDVGEHLEHLLS